MTGSLEKALRSSEQAAKSVAQAAAKVMATAKLIEKAASTGDLSQLRSTLSRLQEAASEMTAAADVAVRQWPWSESAEEDYLRSGFPDEFRRASAAAGITLNQYRDVWSAYPVIVRIEPKARAVKLDRRRVRTLRPSVLVKTLAHIRQAKPRQRPEQFLQILQAGYVATVARHALESGSTKPGASVRLVDVHQALTLLPDSRKDYPLEDFTRDLHHLDLSGIRVTSDGHMLHLSAAASTKSGARVLTVIDDDGKPYHYYAIAFRKDQA